MRRKLLIFITLNSLFQAWVFGTDMVIFNGKVVTNDPLKPHAEAVAIEGNHIKAVGTRAEIETLIDKHTVTIDAQGGSVLPGFNDAHLHFIGGGQSLLQLDLSGCANIVEIQNKVAAAARNTPAGDWITGRGWDHTLFNHGKWPTKGMLDAVTGEHPVFLRRIDGHVGWANSKALQRAGITSNTASPEGGEIGIDKKTGQLTGILKESAMNLITQKIPSISQEQKERALYLALQKAARLGVTSIQDNSGVESLMLYKKLEERGELTVRVSEWLDFAWAKSPDVLIQKIEILKNYKSDKIRLGLFKGFVDGTLGSRTAYFFEPYDDDNSTVGLPQYSQEELNHLVSVADSLKLQIGLHCIGSKANYMALTAYANAQEKNDSKNLRHRLEHAQVLRLADIPDLAKYGIVASMQPTHCTSDLRWAEKRIGYERCKGAYAWRRILDSGAALAFGTDWPVEPLDPMRGLYSAVTRKNIKSGEPENGWFPDQCLSIEEAIYCYTAGPAYAEHQEGTKGRLAPGQLADLVILSKDLLSIPPEEILTTHVNITIFDGKIIYQKE